MDTLAEIVYLLQSRIPLSSKHRGHTLTSNWSGFHECHIEPDWLLI